MGKEVVIRPSNSNVTTKQNVTGAFTPIMEIEVPAQHKFRIQDKPGNRTPLMAKLYDGTGAELPDDAELILGYKAPGKHVAKEEAYLPYGPFAGLSIAEQSDSQKQGNLNIGFNKPLIDFYPDDTIVVLCKSSAQVDWTQSSILRFKVEEIPV